MGLIDLTADRAERPQANIAGFGPCNIFSIRSSSKRRKKA
jgi:hypothetical protein